MTETTPQMRALAAAQSCRWDTALEAMRPLSDHELREFSDCLRRLAALAEWACGISS